MTSARDAQRKSGNKGSRQDERQRNKESLPVHHVKEGSSRRTAVDHVAAQVGIRIRTPATNLPVITMRSASRKSWIGLARILRPIAASCVQLPNPFQARTVSVVVMRARQRRGRSEEAPWSRQRFDRRSPGFPSSVPLPRSFQ